jgi:integrase/recombinase XerD
MGEPRKVQVSQVPSIEIFVRHRVGCKSADDAAHKLCGCFKHLRWTHGGKQYRQAAKTKSWKTAEAVRRRIEETFEQPDAGPIKIEAESRQTIERTIELFVSDKRSQKVSAGVLKKYTLELGRFQSFLAKRSKHFPADITQADLTEFRERWDEIYPSSMTQSKVQERLRSFLRYCYESQLIERVPRLSPIKVDEPPTLPFSDEQYRKLLGTIEVLPKVPPTKRARIHALVQLMRHSGLAIRDAVTLEREELQKGSHRIYRVVTSRQKTGTHVSVPIPPDVATEILSVANGHPNYIFWNSGEGAPETAVKKWHKDLRRLLNAAGLKKFRPHSLRDTFAVSLLKNGVPLEEVSKLLGHDSIKTTEKHYAKWVKARQDRLDSLVMATWR